MAGLLSLYRMLASERFGGGRFIISVQNVGIWKVWWWQVSYLYIECWHLKSLVVAADVS